MTSSTSFVIVTFILQDGDMSNSIRVPLYSSATTAADADGAATVEENKTAPTLRRIAKDAMRRFVIMRRRNDNPRTHSLSEALRRATNKQIAVTEMFVGVKDQPQAEVFPNDLVTHVVQLDKEVIFLKLVILPAESEKTGETVAPCRSSPQSESVASEPLLKGSSDTLTHSGASSAAPARRTEEARAASPLRVFSSSLLGALPSNETTTSVPLLVVKEDTVCSQGTLASASPLSKERSPAPRTPSTRPQAAKRTPPKAKAASPKTKSASPKQKAASSPRPKAASPRSKTVSPQSKVAPQRKRSRAKEVATPQATEAAEATPPKRQAVERYETPSLSLSSPHTREGSSPPVLTVNVFATQPKTATNEADLHVANRHSSSSTTTTDATPPVVARQLQFPSDNSTPGETAQEPSVEFVASRRSSRSNPSKRTTPAKKKTPSPAVPSSADSSAGNKTLPHRAEAVSPPKRASPNKRTQPTPTPTNKTASTPTPSKTVSKALFQNSPDDVAPMTPSQTEEKAEQPPDDNSPGIRARRHVELPSYFAELFRPKMSDYMAKLPLTPAKH